MAIQSPFFGKREPDTSAGLRPGTLQPRGLGSTGVVPQSANVTATPVPDSPAAAAAPSATPSAAPTIAAAPAASEGGSRLTVGPNIKLKGVEITDCDTLFVEGTVEATMDSRLMQIAEGGAFKGSAEIDVAEIHGEFDGQLTARHKLVIHATGRVTGTVRYGKLVIEEGGQISGEIQVGASAGKADKAQAPQRGSLQPA